MRIDEAPLLLPQPNSDIKPPLLLVARKMCNRPGEKTAKPVKIKNSHIEIRNRSDFHSGGTGGVSPRPLAE